MKANFQHLGFDQVTDSFLCYWVKAPHFGFHWHYHPELEITYVQKGRGIRLVGNNVNHFQEGDFVFLGSNLPHTWISDDDFNQKKDNMEVIVLQFPPQLFQDAFLQISEMASIQRLLRFSARGIRFNGAVQDTAVDILKLLMAQNGFHRFQSLLNLLDLLGSEGSFELLASPDYIPNLNEHTEKRLLKVCRYVHEHFTSSIRLEDIAQLANMNPTSFCRFFKKMTGQTLLEYILDLRVGKACNLLIEEPNKSISEIAHRSGFSSQTHFNRIFLKKKKMKPGAFRKIRAKNN